MTALSVWWRQNFGHRNDPPAMLPDPVTWTLDLVTARNQGQLEEWVDQLNELEGHNTPGERWELAQHSSDGRRLTLTREDGRYRWRDTGFRGF